MNNDKTTVRDGVDRSRIEDDDYDEDDSNDDYNDVDFVWMLLLLGWLGCGDDYRCDDLRDKWKPKGISWTRRNVNDEPQRMRLSNFDGIWKTMQLLRRMDDVLGPI